MLVAANAGVKLYSSFLLGWVYGNQIRQGCYGAYLALRIPIEHYLHLDTKNTLQQILNAKTLIKS